MVGHKQLTRATFPLCKDSTWLQASFVLNTCGVPQSRFTLLSRLYPNLNYECSKALQGAHETGVACSLGQNK